MAYELELIQHEIDKKTHDHHFIVQVVEVDENGNELSRGEHFQRSFGLTDAGTDYDFDKAFAELKAHLIERHERVKVHTTTLDSLIHKHFRTKRDSHGKA